MTPKWAMCVQLLLHLAQLVAEAILLKPDVLIKLSALKVLGVGGEKKVAQ